MRTYLLFVALAGSVGTSFGQTAGPAAASTPSPCDSTKILSVQNLASHEAANALGSLAKISWCDFEFPPPTTPVTSVLVHGQRAFIPIHTMLHTSPVTSVIYHGYPSFTPQELVVQLPNSGLSTGSVELQLRRGSSTIASKSIQMDEYAPGIFTLDGTATGEAIVQDLNLDYIFDANPAHPGQVVTIFCEGLGPTNPFVPAGSVPTGLAFTASNPQIYVGNQLASLVISDLRGGNEAPSAAGIYNVSFVVPSVSGANISQPIYITIGGKTSNIATIPVAP